MKMKKVFLTVVLLFLTQNLALAERQLERAEILQVFETLTRQPRETWIPSGTIKATHSEYKSSDGYVTDSTVTVRYDGERFYWEINVDSRKKQAESGTEPTSRSSQDNFDLNWNKRRVFVWDGERYTMYFRPGNHAIVHENPTDIPVGINGPLTAGIIPWGYGIFTLENLTGMESAAEVDGEGHIHLRLNKTGAPEMVFVLDPSKDYALFSSSMEYAGGSSVTRIYGGYELFSGKWVPATIIIERHDNRDQSPKLLSRDYWNLTFVSPVLPQTNSFRAPYETDALVEFYSPISKKALWYRYYSEVDTDLLLEKRLEIALTKDSQSQNCATVAMTYVLERFGKNVTDQELAKLVRGPDKSTSLYALRQFARDLDLHCLAVKTDISTLKNLKGCQVILHLPAANHYVVLEYIDDEYVWIIDLDSDKFFYRTSLKEFALTWSEGTTLLISDKPLGPDPNDILISDSELSNIIGSTEGGLPNFSCTDRIQNGRVITCDPMMGGICPSVYQQFWPRCGCQEDEQGSGCSGVGMPGVTSCPCVEDVSNPGFCTLGTAYYVLPIRACEGNCQ